MNAMSRDYVEAGRTQQKQRTRDQLLAAAWHADGERRHPARRGGRRSGRHLPHHRLPLLRVAGGAAGRGVPGDRPRVDAPGPGARGAPAIGSLPSLPPWSTASRRPSTCSATMLRLSLGDAPHDLPLRQGRVIPWFEEALEPLRERLGDDAVHRLAVALRSVCGIETRVWLSDIAGLDARRRCGRYSCGWWTRSRSGLSRSPTRGAADAGGRVQHDRHPWVALHDGRRAVRSDRAGQRGGDGAPPSPPRWPAAPGGRASRIVPSPWVSAWVGTGSTPNGAALSRGSSR